MTTIESPSGGAGTPQTGQVDTGSTIAERDRQRLERFVELSSVLTGFAVFDLWGTGVAEDYLKTACCQVGQHLVDVLITRISIDGWKTVLTSPPKKDSPVKTPQPLFHLPDREVPTLVVAAEVASAESVRSAVEKALGKVIETNPEGMGRIAQLLADADDKSAVRRAVAELLVATVCAVTEMWYLGHWPHLAPEAYATLTRTWDALNPPEMGKPVSSTGFPAPPRLDPASPHPAPPNRSFVISPQSYVESLVWKTFPGGHPMGAKPPGFGSWAEPTTDPWQKAAEQKQAGGQQKGQALR